MRRGRGLAIAIAIAGALTVPAVAGAQVPPDARVEGAFTFSTEVTESPAAPELVGDTSTFGGTFSTCPAGPCAFMGAFDQFGEGPIPFEPADDGFRGTEVWPDAGNECADEPEIVWVDMRIRIAGVDPTGLAVRLTGELTRWSVGYTSDGDCDDVARHLVSVSRIEGTRIDGAPASGLTYTFAPGQGPEGTEISFAGSGCPPDPAGPDLTFVVASGPGRALTFEARPDGTFAGTYPVAGPREGDPGTVFPTSVTCTSTAQEFSAGDFTIGAALAQPSPTTTPEPSGLAARTHPNRSVFASAIRAPADVAWALGDVARSALLALILTVLIVFPAELFNSTLDANIDRIRAGWRRLRRTPAQADEPRRRLSRGWPAFLAFSAVTALVYGFLDPTFGLDRASITLYLGILVSMVAVSLTYGIATVLFMRRRGARPRLEVIPGTLLIGIACVVASRLVDFEPGYLYGLVAGFAFGVELSARDEGRSVAVATIWSLGLSLAAWFAWSAVRDAASDPDAGIAVLLLDAVLAALFSAGLGGAVFSLVPMRFLSGEKLFRWSKSRWAAVFAISAFAYVQLLLSPASGSRNSSIVTVVALFAGFGILSVAFWAWFRFRRAPEPVS